MRYSIGTKQITQNIWTYPEARHSRPERPRSLWSAPRIETSGRSRSLVLTRRIAASGDENGNARKHLSMLKAGKGMRVDMKNVIISHYRLQLYYRFFAWRYWIFMSTIHLTSLYFTTRTLFLLVLGCTVRVPPAPVFASLLPLWTAPLSVQSNQRITSFPQAVFRNSRVKVIVCCERFERFIRWYSHVRRRSGHNLE